MKHLYLFAICIFMLGKAFAQTCISPSVVTLSISDSDSTLCPGDSLIIETSIQTSDNFAFEWFKGSTTTTAILVEESTSSSITVDYAFADEYIVRVYDKNNPTNQSCWKEASIEVAAAEVPETAMFRNSNLVCNDFSPLEFETFTVKDYRVTYVTDFGEFYGLYIHDGIFYPDSLGIGESDVKFVYNDPNTGCQSDTLYGTLNVAFTEAFDTITLTDVNCNLTDQTLLETFCQEETSRYRTRWFGDITDYDTIHSNCYQFNFIEDSIFPGHMQTGIYQINAFRYDNYTGCLSEPSPVTYIIEECSIIPVVTSIYHSCEAEDSIELSATGSLRGGVDTLGWFYSEPQNATLGDEDYLGSIWDRHGFIEVGTYTVYVAEFLTAYGIYGPAATVTIEITSECAPTDCDSIEVALTSVSLCADLVYADVSGMLIMEPSGGSGQFISVEPSTATINADGTSFRHSGVGDYLVTYRFTNENGCSADFTDTIHVNPLAVPEITPNTLEVCAGFELELGVPGSYETYFWGGPAAAYLGGATTVPNPTFTAPELDGYYDITVAVTDELGCPGDITRTISVHPVPISCPTPAPIIADIETCYQEGNNLEITYFDGDSLLWYYIDGADTTELTTIAGDTTFIPADFGFTESGVYEFGVSQMLLNPLVTGNPECRGPIGTFTLTIYQLPEFSFVPNDTACYDPSSYIQIDVQELNGSTITRTDFTLNPASDNLTLVSAGIRRTFFAHNYFYNDYGLNSYTIEAVTTDANGCEYTNDTVIYIQYTPVPISNDYYGTTDNPQPIEIMARRLAETNFEHVTWYNDSMIPLSTDNPFITGEDPTVVNDYTYFLTQTVNGCESEAAEVEVSILDCPVPTPLVSNVHMCDYESAPQLTAEINTDSTAWLYITGRPTQTANIELRWYNESGDFVYSGESYTPANIDRTQDFVDYFVREYNPYVEPLGCTGLASQVRIYIHKVTPEIIPDILEVYAEESLLISAIVDSATINSYQWSGTAATYLTSTVVQTPTFTAPSEIGEYDLTLNVENEYGCSATIETSVTVTVTDNTESFSFDEKMQISGGYNHSVAIASDGRVYAWGKNEYYNPAGYYLGVGAIDTYVTIPTEVLFPTGAEIIQVDAGSGFHSLAIDCTSSAWAWGLNNNGQTGTTDDITQIVEMPLQVRAGEGPADEDGYLTSVSRIAGATSSSYAVVDYNNTTFGGRVLAWGANGNGELGIGVTSDYESMPIYVKTDSMNYLENVIAIDASDASCYAIVDEDGDGYGTVYGWGPSIVLEGDEYLYATPILKEDGSELDNIKMIAAGDVSCFALDKDGFLWGIGNTWGCLTGSGLGSVHSLAYKVLGGATGESYLTNVRTVSAGQGFTVAVLETGEALAWGINSIDNSGGSLGLGEDIANTCDIGPQYMRYANGSIVENTIDIATGDTWGFLLTEDNEMFTWGNNSNGQLGIGTIEDAPFVISVDISLRDPQPRISMTDTIYVCPNEDVEISSGCLVPTTLEDRYTYNWQYSNDGGVTWNDAFAATGSASIENIIVNETGTYKFTVSYIGDNMSCSNQVERNGVVEVLNWQASYSAPEAQGYCADSLMPYVEGEGEFAWFGSQTGNDTLGYSSNSNPTVEVIDVEGLPPISTNPDTYEFWVENRNSFAGILRTNESAFSSLSVTARSIYSDTDQGGQIIFDAHTDFVLTEMTVNIVCYAYAIGKVGIVLQNSEGTELSSVDANVVCPGEGIYSTIITDLNIEVPQQTGLVIGAKVDNSEYIGIASYTEGPEYRFPEVHSINGTDVITITSNNYPEPTEYYTVPWAWESVAMFNWQILAGTPNACGRVPVEVTVTDECTPTECDSIVIRTSPVATCSDYNETDVSILIFSTPENGTGEYISVSPSTASITADGIFSHDGTPGTYIVSYEWTETATGCSAVASDTVFVFPTPSVTISPDPLVVYVDELLGITANSESSSIVQYEWGGDAVSYLSSVTSPNTLFEGSPIGEYDLTLNVENEYGCASEVSTFITVLDLDLPISMIDFDSSSVTVDLTDRVFALSYTTEPDNVSSDRLNWESSNSNIATVDTYGNITPLDTGSVVITAWSNDIYYVSDSCVVNVISVTTVTSESPEVIAEVPTITVTDTTNSIEINLSQYISDDSTALADLQLSIEGAEDLIIENNNGVAVITGVNLLTDTTDILIHVEDEDGNVSELPVTIGVSTTQIEISEAPVIISEVPVITITDTTLYIEIDLSQYITDDNTALADLLLSISISNENSNLKEGDAVALSIENTNGIAVISGVNSIADSANIIIIIEDSDGNTTDLAIKVKVEFTTVYVTECGKASITVYPNPVSDIVNLSININQQIVQKIEMIDKLGKTVFSKTIEDSGYDIETIDVSKLPSGVYIIKVFAGDEVLTEQLIIE